ncbi:MAG: HIT family protein [Granulosicoccus sp.]
MSLHPRLEADTLTICETHFAYARLMNDSRWPWVILIPKQNDVAELHDLTHTQREGFMADVNQVSRVVHVTTQCQSVNVAMLGNVVSQLHCHVVARNPGDPNWPAPIWGFESPVSYDNNLTSVQILFNSIQKSFS